MLAALEHADPRKWPPIGYGARVELVAALLATQGKHAEAVAWINREIENERDIELKRGKPPSRRRSLEKLRARLAKK